jgi:probable phosphoglycerate mutase
LTEIYLIRHAEAEGNLYRRMHGQYNSLLTVRGERQVADLRRSFENTRIDRVYSSDLYRAKTTSNALSAPRGLTTVTTAGLREMNLGVWEDVTFGDTEYTDPEKIIQFNRDPWVLRVDGAEDYLELQSRVTRAVSDIASQCDGGVIALFSHGVAIRALMCELYNVTTPEGLTRLPHCDNTAVSHLTYRDGVLTADSYGDNSHLQAENSTLARQKWWRENGDSKDFNLRFVRTGASGKLSYDALLSDRRTGFLSLDESQHGSEGVGFIERLELDDDHRGRGMGVQLLGQAISVYRAMGRRKLRTRVFSSEPAAVEFFTYYGFTQTGTDGAYQIFEKDIAVES